MVNTSPPSSSPFDIVGLVGTVIGNVENWLAVAENYDITGLIKPLAAGLQNLDQLVQGNWRDLWKQFSSSAGGSIYTAMLEEGLGVDTSQFDADAQRGLQTTETMLTFALLLTFAAGALELVGKMELGGRWSEQLSKGLQELMQEFGLSWALGISIEKAFDAAVGRSLEEAIFFQKQPNKPDWPIARAMLRQHILSPDDLDLLLRNAGFGPEWRSKIVQLADQRPALGDIQQAFLHGIIDATGVDSYLESLGFSAVPDPQTNISDRNLLKTLYIDKVETEAAREYSSVARQQFLQQLISEQQYRDILTAHNYPKLEIDDNVAAIRLVQENGRIAGTVGAIKSGFLHHTIDMKTAGTQLGQLGYSPQAIAELIQAWAAPPIHPVHGLSQAKILSYLVSGIIDPDQARTRLTALNLDPATIDLLLAHPTASNGVRQHPLTPAFVTTALLDGVLTLSQLPAALTSAGVPRDLLDQYVAVAEYKLAHKRGPAPGHVPLSAGQIVEAWQYGLMDQPTAITGLEQLGYSSDAALLLLEIKNKGLIQPPPTPLFSSLDTAIAYLESLGWKVTQPPDPRIAAAEGMIYAAGYGLTPPPPVPA